MPGMHQQTITSPTTSRSSKIMRKSLQISALALGSMAAFASLAQGQSTVIQYTFVSDLNPTTEAANVTGTSLSGLTDGTRSISHSGGEGPRLDGSTLPIDDGTASVPGRAFSRAFVTDGDGNFQHYFQFGFTVDSGNITFGSGSSVEFDSGHRNKSATKYAVAYSTDGFTTQSFLAGGPAVADGLSTVVGTASPPPGGSWDWKRINNTFSIGTMDAGDTLDFRFYLGESADVSVNTDFSHYIDNITVTAVVPEPSTYAALFGLFGLGLVMYRRRR